MSNSAPSMSYRALLAAEEAEDAEIESAGAEKDKAADSQIEFEPQPNPASETEAAPPSPAENNADENAPANNLADFAAADDDSSKADDNNARQDEEEAVAPAAVVTTPQRQSESESPKKKSSSPSPLKSKSQSPAPKSAASTPEKEIRSPSPAKRAVPFVKTPYPAIGSRRSVSSLETSNSPSPLIYKASPFASPLPGIRLSFDSVPPIAPPTSPAITTEFNRASLSSISELETAKTGSYFWSEESVETQSTVTGRDLQHQSDVPSYWILPQPGARLAEHLPKPSFIVGRKMQLVAQRDAEENAQREMAAKQKAASERMAHKQTHHGHVLERLADQTDDWWDWKEHVVQKKMERFNRIEDCHKARVKKLSVKMFLSERQKLQKQKERLAEEKMERQEAEILNTWLMHAPKV